jgi:PilZ domain
MAKLINHLTTRLRTLLGNRRGAARREAELEAQVQARLLLSVSLAPEAQERAADALRPAKLIGGTRNLSETGLAIVLPSIHIGSSLIIEEDCALRIVLDIYPAGLVEMDTVAVHHRRLEEKEGAVGHLVGVRITGMSDSDRARYLAYLASLELREPPAARAD